MGFETLGVVETKVVILVLPDIEVTVKLLVLVLCVVKGVTFVGTVERPPVGATSVLWGTRVIIVLLPGLGLCVEMGGAEVVPPVGFDAVVEVLNVVIVTVVVRVVALACSVGLVLTEVDSSGRVVTIKVVRPVLVGVLDPPTVLSFVIALAFPVEVLKVASFSGVPTAVLEDTGISVKFRVVLVAVKVV